MITGLYTGILGFWLIYLIVMVVKQRLKFKVGLSHGGKKQLLKAIRIHGNFTETVPYVLIIMFLMESLDYAGWLIHGFGVLLILSRALHWHGLKQNTGISYGRKVGTSLILFLVGLGSLFLILDYIL